MTLDDILAKVAHERTQIDSWAALLAGLHQQIDDALGATLTKEEQGKVDAVFQKMLLNAKKISDAINFVPTAKATGVLTQAEVAPISTDNNINAVMCGMRWGFTKLPAVITVSFPTAGSFYVGNFGAAYGGGEHQQGFRAFNATQQAQVMKLLGLYTEVCGLEFKQIEETLANPATLRYAYSSMPYTAWGYYPSAKAEGGDGWFNTGKGWYEDFVLGTYAALTFIHETGHMLGLKHPHEGGAIFNGKMLGDVRMPIDRDCLEFTVMSYRSYQGKDVGSGYSNAGDSYPQTPMMYDIASMRQMYGPPSKPAGAPNMWDPATGERIINGIRQGRPWGNKVFHTVCAACDFSNYPGVVANQVPGGFTVVSQAQRANLGGGQLARGNVFNCLGVP